MRCQLTPDDCVEAMRIDHRSRPWARTIGAVLLVGGVTLIVLELRNYLAGNGSAFNLMVMTVPLLYVIGLLTLRHWVIIPRYARKIYRQQKALHDPFEVEVVHEGLRFLSPLGDGVLPWDHIYRWRESPNLLLIYHSDNLRNILPKRDLGPPDAIDGLKQRLEAEIGPENRPRPIDFQAQDRISS